MPRLLSILAIALGCLLAFSLEKATAAGRVQLELAGDSRQGAAMGFQQWVQTLGQAGIRNVRLRTANDTDRPSIDVRGTEANPIYVVVGIISSRDEIVVPGGRFRRSEVKQLAAWLDDLEKNGPADRREPLAAFGLKQKDFDAVREDLSRRVGFSTQGMERSAAVQQIAKQLSLPVKIDGSLADPEDKVEEELSELSCGTALACVLRPAGYAMVPRATERGLVYTVAKAQLDREVWPIGWPPEKPQADVLPGLFETRNVNIERVSAADVLLAVGKRVKAPVLMDHNAMARHGVDPKKGAVSHPSKRTSYGQALRRILFQAGLQYEIRVDEAGNPLLWITTVKPV